MLFRRSKDHRGFDDFRILWADLPYPRLPDCGVCVAYARDHGNFEPHCHGDFYELVIVVNGSGINSLEGKDYTISEGSVFIIHPGQQHGYSDARSLDLFNICIHESTLESFPPSLLSSPGFVALFCVEPTLRHRKGQPSQLILSSQALEEAAHSADRVRKLLAAPEPLNSVRAFALLTDLLAKISIEYQTPEPSTPKRTSLSFAKALSFIEQNYMEAITIGDIARHAGFSIRSLHRACLDYAGVSPKKLLTDIRIDHAKRLLLEESYSVTETAFATGFADSNHFSKCFRHRVGSSPRDFRNSALAADAAAGQPAQAGPV